MKNNLSIKRQNGINNNSDEHNMLDIIFIETKYIGKRNNIYHSTLYHK